MTKAGASGPKARARKAQRVTGAKYVKIRHSSRPSVPGRTVQFLYEDRHDLGVLPLQIAGAWARSGLRVLLLHEYKPAPMDMRLYSKRAKERKAAEERQAAWPGHRSTLLWRPTRGSLSGGLLVSQHTPWSIARDAQRLPYDDSPLRTAVGLARSSFDIVVLAGGSGWPRKAHADHFVLLAETDGLPVSESMVRWQENGPATVEQPLSPEQSAALLRDRHLRFLHHWYEQLKPPLGMVACSHLLRGGSEPDIDPVFLRAVKDEMSRAGLPLLGLISAAHEGLREYVQHRSDPAAALSSTAYRGVEDVAHAIRTCW
ncbi:hypothetical protein ACWF62_20400 [Rhodococcus sp. NPDC054953]